LCFAHSIAAVAHTICLQNKDGWLSTHLRKLKSDHRSLVLGMTGTLMQNDHNELWNLIDLVETGYLGTWEQFKSEVSIPIKIGR
jgi:SNF2 family DNA or RNA helicase